MDDFGDSSKFDIRNNAGHSTSPLINNITEKVIGSAFTVINTLGAGFLEKVNENALAHEIRKCGLAVAQQVDIDVRYDQIRVGMYTADLLIEGKILVELKVVKALNQAHHAVHQLPARHRFICLPADEFCLPEAGVS
jgi:GxxExxY protein